MAPSKQESKSASTSSQTVKKEIQKVAPAPTEGDGVGNGEKTKSDGEGNGEKKTLRQIAMGKLNENPSQLGDPISLKAETANSEPTDQDRGAAAGKAAGKSKL